MHLMLDKDSFHVFKQMAAAASFRSSTPETNDTITQKLFYQYLTDQTLYELLSRVKNGLLNQQMRLAFRDSSDNDLRGITAEASVNESSQSKDIYILIQIKLNNRNYGHITLHLMPFNTRSNTIGPLHIRNNTCNIRVSRIRINAHGNGQTIQQIVLSRGSGADKHYAIGNTKLGKACEPIFGVLNAYLDNDSTQSLSIPSKNTNYRNAQIREWVREITAPQRGATRIQRTHFSIQHGIYGGSSKRNARRKHRKGK
jgi:hypothetical protein